MPICAAPTVSARAAWHATDRCAQHRIALLMRAHEDRNQLFVDCAHDHVAMSDSTTHHRPAPAHTSVRSATSSAEWRGGNGASHQRSEVFARKVERVDVDRHGVGQVEDVHICASRATPPYAHGTRKSNTARTYAHAHGTRKHNMDTNTTRHARARTHVHTLSCGWHARRTTHTNVGTLTHAYDAFTHACMSPYKLICTFCMPTRTHSIARHCMALHGTALHGIARHGTARHCIALTALHGTALHCTARHSTALHGTAQHGTALHGTALHSTALHSTDL
jgi:hypothetical protein